MRYSLLITFFLVYFQTKAQVKTRNYYADKDLIPRERQVDFTHLKLTLDLKPEAKMLEGVVEHRFIVLRASVDTLFLDGINMEVLSVSLDGKPIEYNVKKKGITLLFPTPLEWNNEHLLKIKYKAKPRKGLYFIGWEKDLPNSKNQVWSQGQGIDNRHWIPMYDEKNDKIVSEMILNFDSEYEVLSNGQLVSKKKSKDGTTRWHYKISHPHAPYLLMLGIGKYKIYKTKSESGIPLNLYYYPDQPEQREPTYRFSKQMFDFFEKEIGVPYPWKTYSQIPVQDFMYGAMENTTATIFGDFYLVDNRTYLDKNYVRVDAHELAHQWFGDKITARSSAHHWLQEGFATHYDMMFQKEAFGQEHFDWVRRNYNEQALNASKTDLKPIAHSAAGVVRHYPKGAFVLEMLKYVVGREQFNAAIKYYLEKHAYANVNSNDLLVAFHERLGLSLNWFWEEWVYKGGEPKYEVNFDSNSKHHTFEVSQSHPRNELVGLFKMPIVFQIVFSDGSTESKRVVIEKENQKVRFTNDGRAVSFVLFDPNSQIMSEVEFTKSTEMLKEQAKSAQHMLDRYDALVSLRARSFEGKNQFLLDRFKQEKFHGLRSEIAIQLMPLMNEYSAQIIELGLSSNDHELKKTILDQTFRIKSNHFELYKSLLTDSSYVVIEKAMNLLSFYAPQNFEEYYKLTEGIDGNRSHNVKIARLKNAYAVSKQENYLEELVKLSSAENEFTTRVAVFNALKEINSLNEDALKHLFNALMSFNSRLRGPAKKTIDHFFAQNEFKIMIVDYVSNQNWSTNNFKRVSPYMAY